MPSNTPLKMNPAQIEAMVKELMMKITADFFAFSLR